MEADAGVKAVVDSSAFFFSPSPQVKQIENQKQCSGDLGPINFFQFGFVFPKSCKKDPDFRIFDRKYIQDSQYNVRVPVLFLSRVMGKQENKSAALHC